MGVRKIEMTITLVLVSMLFLWTGVDAQSNCASAIMSLSPCMSFNFGNSSSTPSSSCCSQLASLVQTTPMCLCEVMNGSGAELLGRVLNRTLAQALPSACNVETPPLTNCYNDAGLGTSQNNPSDGAYSGGIQLKTSLLLASSLIFIAFYAPIFCGGV